jgi:hypothetical protein
MTSATFPHGSAKNYFVAIADMYSPEYWECDAQYVTRLRDMRKR